LHLDVLPRRVTGHVECAEEVLRTVFHFNGDGDGNDGGNSGAGHGIVLDRPLGDGKEPLQHHMVQDLVQDHGRPEHRWQGLWRAR
jgi:hypothetical protein